MCPHLHPEVHVLGQSTFIYCSDCREIVDADLPLFLKTA
ncbi:hypothetical protein BN970_01346 [Mycolicibacterium conceptionense]|uniref:Uncharacterized protein n=1 Tax=Mycolicibacterium conceptionense TaxID=451644 RepID=A0A0U1D300_9MYCO|nr:hypothetical protein BN970_01346 [Mycolicibacterium conceptionense]